MPFARVTVPAYKSTDLGGGPFTGFSPVQSSNGYNTSENINSRRILTKAWNRNGAVGAYNGYARVITPFRAVTNSGDFLARQYYVCGGPNAVNHTQNGRVMSHRGNRPMDACDGTGVPCSNSNNKYVYYSSDYVRFRKLKSLNKTYNDLSYGGDQNNASYTALKSVVGGNSNRVP